MAVHWPDSRLLVSIHLLQNFRVRTVLTVLMYLSSVPDGETPVACLPRSHVCPGPFVPALLSLLFCFSVRTPAAPGGQTVFPCYNPAGELRLDHKACSSLAHHFVHTGQRVLLAGGNGSAGGCWDHDTADAVEKMCRGEEPALRVEPVAVAVGETVILRAPPSPFSRFFNMDGEGVPVK